MRNLQFNIASLRGVVVFYGAGFAAASPRPRVRRTHWHFFRFGKRGQPDAGPMRSEWLPPIPVNMQGIEDLTMTVREVRTRGVPSISARTVTRRLVRMNA
jgi:hypothetical protein